jgi:hypothetical protein
VILKVKNIQSSNFKSGTERFHGTYVDKQLPGPGDYDTSVQTQSNAKQMSVD